MIYHLVTPAQWEKWSDSDHYKSPAFLEEGFIHLCTATQLAGVHVGITAMKKHFYSC